MNIKLNDVYLFRYNEEYNKNYLRHLLCFDGQLIVKQNRNGNYIYKIHIGVLMVIEIKRLHWNKH